MAVQMPAISQAGDLTFSTLKQYAYDNGLADRSDTKAVRRAERIVNQAVKRLCGDHNWSWLLRRHRLLLRPRIQYTSACSMSAEGNTITLLSGTWDTAAAQYSFRFSGDTEIMRVKTRDSSTQLTTFSSDVYVASTAASGATGFLIKDRYQLPANFKCIAEDLHEKDFFGPTGEIPRGEMLHLQQTYTPSTGSPVNYVLDVNPYTQRYEFLFWQPPSELRSADLYIYVWPTEMSNDSDVLDFDPNLTEVIYAAINLKAVSEARQWKSLPAARQDYMDALQRAKQADRKMLNRRLAGLVRSGTKPMRLNRLFTNES